MLTGFIILVLAGLDSTSDKLNLSTPVGAVLTVVLYLLTAFLRNNLADALRPVKRRIQAFSQDWPFVYKMYAQFETQVEPSITDIARYLSEQRSWKGRFEVTFRGYNYLQAQFNSPDVTLLISFQPKYTYDGDSDSEDAPVEAETYVVEGRPSHTVTYWFRFHRSADDLKEVLRLVAEISAELSRHSQGSRAKLTANVNRYVRGKKIASRGPTHQGAPKHINGLVIYKDLYAMQLISESPGDVKNHLFDGLTELEPVQAA